MAQRRMVSLKIVDTDDFLAMPVSSRLLYLDLLVRADDDGFVGSPKKVMKMIGATEDDFKVLCGKQYVYPFESGVCVIRDWKIHNLIQRDRYNETHYRAEKGQLECDENGSYTPVEGLYPKCIQNVSTMETQVRLGKVRIGKVSEGKIENETLIYPDKDIETAWVRFRDYKRDEFKFRYKSKVSEQTAINDLISKCNGDNTKAGAIVDQSIASGWKGLFELKKNKTESSDDVLNKFKNRSRK